MRTVYNVEPLFRSSIGFDRIVNLLENAAGGQTIDSWPPYNIEKIGERDMHERQVTQHLVW